MMSRDSGNSSLIQETTKTKYLFKGKKKSYINIIAVLPSSAKTFRFLPYDAVQVTPTKKTSTSIWIWLMLVVIIFIALILFLISRKTRKIKQRIDIEMTVGRNIPGKGQEKLQLNNEFN
jgi:ATP-dependent Zn protease